MHKYIFKRNKQVFDGDNNSDIIVQVSIDYYLFLRQ